MKRRYLPQTVFLGVLACSGIWVSSSIADPGAAAKPIITGHRVFRIPFRLDAQEAGQLKKIHLYLSRDAGRTWSQCSSAPPTATEFTYHAEEDGHHWFAVRTEDHQGGIHPDESEAPQPGLHVVVDAEPPTVNLTQLPAEPGYASVQWELSDPNLDVESFSLEYRAVDGEGTWQAVAAEPAESGQIEWSATEGLLEVRAAVRDRAGNVAETETVIDALASNDEPAPSALSGVASGAATSNRPMSLEGPRPADRSDAIAAEDAKPKVADDSSKQQDSAGKPVPAAPLSSKMIGGASANQIVNSPHLQIHYEINDVGPSGVGTVELWFTTDDGKSWRKYGTDADQQSPFPVEVKGEGVYGFSMVVRSGVGLGHEPPAPGDKPDMQVVYDATPPMARLLKPKIGRGKDADRVVLQWIAHDPNLTAKPVSLYYAEKPDGPWLPIASSLDKQGSHTWQVDPNSAALLHVRLDARDRAGNVRSVETSEPIVVDRSRPRGHLIGVAEVAPPTPKTLR